MPITLDETIRRAQAVETNYGAAVADAGVAQALGAGSQMLQPPAIAVIGGLLICIVLSLTPVVFFRLTKLGISNRCTVSIKWHDGFIGSCRTLCGCCKIWSARKLGPQWW